MVSDFYVSPLLTSPVASLVVERLHRIVQYLLLVILHTIVQYKALGGVEWTTSMAVTYGGG